MQYKIYDIQEMENAIKALNEISRIQKEHKLEDNYYQMIAAALKDVSIDTAGIIIKHTDINETGIAIIFEELGISRDYVIEIAKRIIDERKSADNE